MSPGERLKGVRRLLHCTLAQLPSQLLDASAALPATMCRQPAQLASDKERVWQVLAERSKEYGSKGWSWLKGAYVSAASHVESVAQENGYKVDLGKLPPCRLPEGRSEPGRVCLARSSGQVVWLLTQSVFLFE